MNNLKKLAAILLVLCMAFALCACSGNDAEPNDNDTVTTTTTEEKVTTTTAPEDESASFKVKVVDQDGNPVAGVMVQVCSEACFPCVTDANGVATFNTEITDEHYLSVPSCPAGYTYTGEEKVYLEEDMTEYTVEIEKEA